MAKKKQPIASRISFGRVISIILTLIVISILFSFLGLVSLVFFGPVPSGNIAVIPVEGAITGGVDSYGAVASSSRITELIRDAEENNEVKAILVEINSGGGSAVASDEIARAVAEAEKPTVAVIREIGTSGAYWVASSADRVFANRMSVTGSIGVIASYLEFAKLLDDYNVTYRRVVAGEYKDMGIPFKEATEDEMAIFQESINKIHSYFIAAIAENREIPEDDVREIATGRFYLGAEALELGLVDELGTKDDAVKYLEEKLNITAELAEYRQRASIYDFMASMKRGAIQGLVTAPKDEALNLQT